VLHTSTDAPGYHHENEDDGSSLEQSARQSLTRVRTSATEREGAISTSEVAQDRLVAMEHPGLGSLCCRRSISTTRTAQVSKNRAVSTLSGADC
jgi:hypothetical protein